MTRFAHLTLRFKSDPPRVVLTLEDGPEDVAWLRLRALFGSSGSQALDNAIVVGAENFLSVAPALRAICLQHRLRIDPDSGVTTLLKRVQALRDQLEAAYGMPSDAPLPDVRERLAGGRFIRQLTDFQTRDLTKLLSLSHGANFSVPGAGKTSVSYATYEAERLSGRVERLAIVGPLSAFDAWISEAIECFDSPPRIAELSAGIDLGCEVLLTNYHRLAGQYSMVADWVGSARTHLILDEAHRVKRGWEGQWGRACLNLAYFAERRDVLTGTPAPQGPEDLLALVDFLWPNVGRRRLPTRPVLRFSGADVVSQVSDALRPLYVRTRKAELGLREPSFTATVIPLEGLHREVYAALCDQYAGVFSLQRADRIAMAQMGHVVMYLIEAATNPGLLVAGSSPSDPIVFRHPPLDLPHDARLLDLLRSFGEYETPRKFEELALLLRRNADLGRKTLVWTNFVRNIMTLRRMFAQYEPAVIHGGVPLDVPTPDGVSRLTELRRFREDPRCLLLIANPAAAGEGVSLHHVCHDAVYLERTFNAGQYLQSVDRIHRLGLPASAETRITYLLTKGTIDEVIDQRVREKAAKLGRVLDDPDIAAMALPDEEEYGPPIDRGDVLALFEHVGSIGQGS